MILIAILFAPTVPSDPRPQNLHEIFPSGAEVKPATSGMDRKVTSSFIPIVKLFFGESDASIWYTPAICAGVVSLDARPYLPPYTSGASSFP